MGTLDELQAKIETRITGPFPAVEVLLVERFGPDGLRIFIDHPEGVDLGLCERVTSELTELLSDHSLEVSSPGIDRPLTRPEHFQRYVGHRVRVRTSEKLDGRKSFTGILRAADGSNVDLDLEGDRVTIPHATIHRSNLVADLPGGGS